MPIGLNIAKWGADGLKPLILNVQTDNSGASSNDQFTVALKTGETYNFTAKYDGQETPHSSTTDLVLTFPSGAGNYDVEIWPQDDGTGFPAIQYNNAADDTKVLEVKQWGSVKFESMNGAFHGCSNMENTATDEPLTSLVDSFFSAFRDCANLGKGIDCDMTGATSTSYMYDDTDITSIILTDMSTITNTSYMFQNGDMTSVPALDLSAVTNATGMFTNSAITSFPAMDFSAATTLASTFVNCTDLTSCGTLTTTTALTNVSSLFNGTGIIDAPSITVTSNVTNWSSMFLNSYIETCPTYDTSGGGSMDSMFEDIYSTTFDIPAFDFSAVTALGDFAAGVSSNRGARSVPAINAPLCTDAKDMCRENKNLTSVGTLTLTGTTGNHGQTFFSTSNLTGTLTVALGSGVTNLTSFCQSSGITGLVLTGTSGVTNFGNFCLNATSLTSVNLIDTSSGTSFSNFLTGCTGLEGFAMPAFDLGAMTNGTNMFNGFAMTTAAWEALLVATEANNSNSSVTWDGGNATYNDPSSAATARAALIADHSWTITDGGSI